ncbi:hypothetical protein AB0F11_30225 [Streptomyces sp. NPDC032472]|uniref:hypothetical protein n=1 Tax=Streptomyces sp. NPDC032472 TaxID=3155018 RepID=UPI00340A304E
MAGPVGGEPLLLLAALGESADDWALVRGALARDRLVYALICGSTAATSGPARTRWS